MGARVVDAFSQRNILDIIVQAVERSTDVVMITRADQGSVLPIVYVNAAFEHMTGYTSEEVLGKTPSLLQGPKTDPAAIARIHTAIENWHPVREELLNYRKDGSEFTLQLSMVPIANSSGAFTHWFSVQRESTEQSALQERVRQSELRLARILRVVPQLIWTADRDGQFDWVSESFTAFVGADQSHCTGDRWLQFVHPSDHDQAASALRQAPAASGHYSGELRLRRADGTYEWFLQRAAADLAADGSIAGWVGTLTEISALKHTEIALQASEERLRLGLGVAKVALSEVDYIAGIHRLSAEMAALYDLGDQSITVPRETVRARFYPEDRERLDARNALTLTGTVPPWFEMDFRIHLSNGDTRWIRSRKLDFLEGEGENRRKIRAIIAAFDITAAKAAEVELSETEQRLRLGIGVAKLGLLDIDYQTQTAHLSAEAARIYGLGDQEMTIPRSVLHRAIHPDDLAAMLHLRSTLPERGTTSALESEYRVIWPNGERRSIRTRKLIQYEGAEPLRATIASFDITEEKNAEQRTAESARRSRELAGGIAHDFNNLLTAIMLRASMASGETDTETLLAHTRAILDVAQTAAGITRQLITLSREHAPPTEVLDLSQRVCHLLEVSGSSLEPGIQVQFRQSDENLAVRMDGPQFDQIFLNLFLNAREAVSSGGIISVASGKTFRVTPDGSKNPSGTYARLAVSNNGPSIPPEIITRLFEPYFTTKSAAKGRGLGLAIVNKIATDHGGEVVVTSEPGGTTCFEVLLPCSDLDLETLRPQPRASISPATAAVQCILVVEDDDSIRNLLQNALTRIGFHVLACSDGRYAIELAEECAHPIDLLITDIRMPRVDGITLARNLTTARPALKVLLISGNLGRITPNQHDPTPSWPLLRKPFTSEQLLQRVAEVIAQ